MSPTIRVLIALVLAIAIGIAISASGSAALISAGTAIEPVGTLFVNAIRMTVVPLVVSSLIVGVASAPNARAIGEVGGRAVALFLAALTTGTLYAALIAPPLLRLVPVIPAFAGMTAEIPVPAEVAAAKVPTVTQWVVDLVPSNPVKAAADGAMLPLIIFTLAFGFAVSRLPAARRDPLTAVCRAISDASLLLVRWILALAPLGVFALALPLATRLGASAAGAVASYVVITAVATTLFALVVIYPAVALFGRTSIREFARAALPAQAVAFSARSSLASLPALMEAGRGPLRLPDAVVSFLMPVAASTFRPGGAVGQTIGVLFLARLYGIELDLAHVLTMSATIVVLTFSIPGIPGGSIVALVPVLLTAGVPVEGVGLLLGVDVIPDMFRTTTNVTGDLAVATIVGRRASAAHDSTDEGSFNAFDS